MHNIYIPIHGLMAINMIALYPNSTVPCSSEIPSDVKDWNVSTRWRLPVKRSKQHSESGRINQRNIIVTKHPFFQILEFIQSTVG